MNYTRECVGSIRTLKKPLQYDITRPIKSQVFSKKNLPPLFKNPCFIFPESPGKNSEKHLTNINLATKIELLSLPGIGESYAERIIAYRETNGPFATIEDIKKVKGIGEAKFAELKDRITVD